MKEQNQEHPTRSAMLKAARSGRIPFRDHLKSCRACRDLLALLTGGEFLALIRETEPSAGLLARCARLPLLEESRRPARALRGTVASDSWRGLTAGVVRDAAAGLERRLRLTAENLVVDLVAERRPGAWDFFARVYDRHEVASDRFVLQTGRQRIVAGPRDMYVWEAKRPPRTIHLVSSDVKVTFELENWRQTE